jgi:small subunit ribosomal protein S8e
VLPSPSRSATGAQRAHYRKKRKFELGRQPAMTKLGAKRIHTVRTRGGNVKHRALRLESGNFAWGSEHCTKKTRLIGVVYNSSNNELVRTNTLVKNSVIQIDATPFRQYYESHYGQPASRKRGVRCLLSVLCPYHRTRKLTPGFHICSNSSRRPRR